MAASASSGPRCTRPRRATSSRCWSSPTCATPASRPGTCRRRSTSRAGTSARSASRCELLLQLAIVFGFLSIVTIGFIFVMLRRSMRPLEHLASLANEISTGERLDQPIKPTSGDEIGQMAKSLNRLRASLQAAMGRLGE
ncbi:MAG: HAMP domain-containing protein [Deltaproteobacteria bacterium]|nr:MAG: HAMP domain-containing protein [Deltaproteobacteria bacterium]